jgi:hypothetical protein
VEVGSPHRLREFLILPMSHGHALRLQVGGELMKESASGANASLHLRGAGGSVGG